MNKRGLELSVNFIVMLIIAIVVFGFAITLSYRLYRGSTDMTIKIDQQTEMRMEALLDDGSLVVIPFEKKTIPRGKLGVFGVGVLNALNRFDIEPFMITLNDILGYLAIKGIDKDGGDIANPESYITPLYDANTIDIPNNDRHKYAIGVEVAKNAPSGTYILNLKVLYDADDSGTVGYTEYYDKELYKIYVIVP